MICFSGERGTSRHASSPNGIVGVQPYSLSFSNREYSSPPVTASSLSASNSTSSAPAATLLVGSSRANNNKNHNHNRSSSGGGGPIFVDIDMKRSYAEDPKKKSSNSTSMPAPKIAHTVTVTATTEPPSSKSTTKFSSATSHPPSSSIDLKPSNSNGTSHSDCAVFLGGSCNPTSWRTDIAIPMLKKAGITYFNPQVENWYPELMEKEHYAKHNADLLFFVIDNQTRGVAAMAEVAYLVASGKKVILVITGFKGPGQLIMDEPISQSEYEELTCGQLLLQDLVERHDIPVFNDINTALKCTAKVIQDRLRPQDLLQVAVDLVQPALNTNTNIKIWVCSNLKKTFENLDSARNGKISLSDVANAWKLLTNGKSGPDPLNKLCDVDSLSSKLDTPTNQDKKEGQALNGNATNGKTLNYEEFCRIFAELILCHRNKSRTRVATPNSGSKTTQTNISDDSSTRTSDKGSENKLVGRIPLPMNSDLPNHDVYLGGPSSGTDKWRTDVANRLNKHNLSYSECETTSLTEKLLAPLDTNNCDQSRVLLFNLTKTSRAVESIIQLAYYIGLKREIVICIENVQDDGKIETDTLSKLAVKDYNRGRSYVSDMAKRDGFQVFHDLNEAVDCVIDKCTGHTKF